VREKIFVYGMAECKKRRMMHERHFTQHVRSCEWLEITSPWG